MNNHEKQQESALSEFDMLAIDIVRNHSYLRDRDCGDENPDEPAVISDTAHEIAVLERSFHL